MGLRKAVSQISDCALLAAFALAPLAPPGADAQVVTATLTGAVADSSGALVPDASVTATDISTGVVRTASTSAEGVYTMPFLPPGTYRVEIQKSGFKTFTENLDLDVSSVGRINATLTPGSQTETVQVTAEAPLLQAESSGVAKNIDSAAAAELPMPDRSVQAMAGLLPGVNLPTLYSSGSGILENSAFTYMFNANGQVLRPDGSVIAGLYAAGLAMANPIGTRAVGPGTTIGPNLTWGFICGNSLLADNRG